MMCYDNLTYEFAVVKFSDEEKFIVARDKKSRDIELIEYSPIFPTVSSQITLKDITFASSFRNHGFITTAEGNRIKTKTPDLGEIEYLIEDGMYKHIDSGITSPLQEGFNPFYQKLKEHYNATSNTENNLHCEPKTEYWGVL